MPWVFVALHRFSLVAVSKGYFSLQCMGSSLQWPLMQLWSTGSRAHRLSSCGSLALEHKGPSSCGSQAQLLRSTWDLPRVGIEPVSPALGACSLSHLTTREVLVLFFYKSNSWIRQDGSILLLWGSASWIFILRPTS